MRRLAGKPAFGGKRVAPLPAEQRAAIAADLMPRLRGLMHGERVKVGHFSDDAETLEFVGSRGFREARRASAPPAPITFCVPRSRR